MYIGDLEQCICRDPAKAGDIICNAWLRLYICITKAFSNYTLVMHYSVKLVQSHLQHRFVKSHFERRTRSKFKTSHLFESTLSFFFVCSNSNSIHRGNRDWIIHKMGSSDRRENRTNSMAGGPTIFTFNANNKKTNNNNYSRKYLHPYNRNSYIQITSHAS